MMKKILAIGIFLLLLVSNNSGCLTPQTNNFISISLLIFYILLNLPLKRKLLNQSELLYMLTIIIAILVIANFVTIRSDITQLIILSLVMLLLERLFENFSDKNSLHRVLITTTFLYLNF